MILGLAIILTLMLLAVVYFDVTAFIIPNQLNLAFVLLWPVLLIASPEKIIWWQSLAVFACFFVGGMLLFMTNIMGGGDIKLIIALSLWLGWHPEALVSFGIWITLSGGILALFLIIVRLLARITNKSPEQQATLPKVLRMREPIPYGLAIAYAFGFMLWTGRIHDLPINL